MKTKNSIKTSCNHEAKLLVRLSHLNSLILHKILDLSALPLLIIVYLLLMDISPICGAQQSSNTYHHSQQFQAQTQDSSPSQKATHFVDQSDVAPRYQKVVAGRQVIFKCAVDDIGNHQLAWFHKDKRLLLGLGNKTINWKDRIHVHSQADKMFFLTIDSVQLDDKVSREWRYAN